jgi:hypothetical protein
LDYLIPDGYGRVFHPQIPLHEMIASLVIYEIMKDYQARIGYAVWTPPPENTSCKKPSHTPSAPPKPKPPPPKPTLIPLPPFEPRYDCKGSKLVSCLHSSLLVYMEVLTIIVRWPAAQAEGLRSRG